MSTFFSKKLISSSVIAIVSVAFLSGCGGGGSGSSSSMTPVAPAPPAPPPAPTGASFSLDGSTTKGLILNGNVDVVDAANPATVLVSGTTSSTDGTYDLTIPDTANFSGPFVTVTVSGGAGATMICDAAAGCVDAAGTAVDFGDSFPIDSNVTLSAIVPTPADGQTDTVNLNIFTDLAASLAQNGPLTETAINDANAQVGDLFGLGDTDLSDLASINIADAATSVADPTDLRAGVISGGVLGAALENGADIGATLEAFRTSFAANDGQIIVNEAVDDPAVLSLEDIFGEANAAADASAVTGSDVASVSAQIFGDANETRGAEAGELSSAGVAPSNNVPALDQAKAFVEDLQLVIAAVDEQPNGDNIEAFAERVEMASELISDDAEAALEAALAASEAIALAFQAFQDDNTLTTFSTDELDVDISSSGGDLSLIIAPQTIGAETVELSVIGDLDVMIMETEVDEFDPTTGESVFEEAVMVSITDSADFTGRVENASLTLDILDGEVDVINGNLDSLDFSQSSESSTFGFSANNQELLDLRADRVSAELDVILTETRTDGLSFEGSAAASLTNPAFRSEDAFVFTQDFSGPNAEQQFISFDSVAAELDASDVAFSGTLSEGGQSVSLSVALRADGQDLNFSTLPEAEDIATISNVDNVLTFSNIGGQIVYELVTAAEAQTELDTGSLGQFAVTLAPSPVSLYNDGPGTPNTAVTAIVNPADPVLRFELISENPNVTPPPVIFAQSSTLPIFFGPFPSFPDGFVESPPANIVDFYNQGIVRTNVPTVSCISTGTSVANITVAPFLQIEPFITPAQTTLQGIPAIENAFAANFCGPGGNNVDSDFSVEDIVEFDSNASAMGLLAISVTQDIAGIDPDDTEVTASLFGPLSFSNDELGGDLTLTLDFAGRTFETDARNIDIFDDLTVPVTVTNQDGVVMVISEDTNGEATGTISLDGVEQGVITEGNGVPIVTFSDNTFVSLR